MYQYFVQYFPQPEFSNNRFARKNYHEIIHLTIFDNYNFEENHMKYFQTKQS